jgi:hypothetical protein
MRNHQSRNAIYITNDFNPVGIAGGVFVFPGRIPHSHSCRFNAANTKFAPENS